MSKSDVNPRSRIELTDTADEIHQKMKKAMTDSTPSMSYDPETRPAIANMVEIHAAVTGQTPAEVIRVVEGLNHVQYKELLTNVINDKIGPIREEINRLHADRGYVESVLDSGATRAREIASETYGQVRKAVGLR